MEATFYDETGRLTGTLYSTDEDGFSLMTRGRPCVPGLVDGGLYYYDTDAGDVAPRPLMPVLQEEARLSGLPRPCTVTIAGESYDVSDGVFEFDSPLAGAYPVAVAAWPYLDWEGEIVIESRPSPWQ